MPRPIVEPGGALLIGLGLSQGALADWAAALYPHVSSLSVLVSQDQQRLDIVRG
jgi:hypothetical protein